ncbi:MAG TPA: hypothetical protein PKE30_09010 [Niabella sp.]|nr:hypothetical protein [Niabella sp.]
MRVHILCIHTSPIPSYIYGMWFFRSLLPAVIEPAPLGQGVFRLVCTIPGIELYTEQHGKAPSGDHYWPL